MTPLLVLLVTSQDCGSYWWNFVPQCNPDLRCVWCLDGQFRFGIEQFCTASHTSAKMHSSSTYQYCAHSFDICDDIENWVLNGTAWVKSGRCTIDTETVCNQRWEQPRRCTMAVLDTVSTFLLAKTLSAAPLPLGALLLCR